MDCAMFQIITAYFTMFLRYNIYDTIFRNENSISRSLIIRYKMIFAKTEKHQSSQSMQTFTSAFLLLTLRNPLQNLIANNEAIIKRYCGGNLWYYSFIVFSLKRSLNTDENSINGKHKSM